MRVTLFDLSPDLRDEPRLPNVTCAWSWRLCGIYPVIRRPSYGQKIPLSSSFFIHNLITRWKHVRVSRPGRFASSDIAASTHCIFSSVESGQKDPFTYKQSVRIIKTVARNCTYWATPITPWTPNSEYSYKFAGAKHNFSLMCSLFISNVTFVLITTHKSMELGLHLIQDLYTSTWKHSCTA